MKSFGRGNMLKKLSFVKLVMKKSLSFLLYALFLLGFNNISKLLIQEN